MQKAGKALGIKPQCLPAALDPLRKGSKIVSAGAQNPEKSGPRLKVLHKVFPLPYLLAGKVVVRWEGRKPQCINKR